MKYKEGIILEKRPIIIGAGFNNGIYIIKCPICNKIGSYYYDFTENQIPKYCTYCKADFEEIEETETNRILYKENENNICNTCRLNNQCPLDYKPNLQCPYDDFEKR